MSKFKDLFPCDSYDIQKNREEIEACNLLYSSKKENCEICNELTNYIDEYYFVFICSEECRLELYKNSVFKIKDG